MRTPIIFFAVAAAFGVSLTRGGLTFKSLIGVNKCSVEDIGIVITYSLLTCALASISYMVIRYEANQKELAKWNYHKDEIKFTFKRVIVLFLIGLFLGTIASMLGLGGGMFFKPILLAYGYPPQVISSTGTFLIIINKFVIAFILLSNNQINLQYFGFISCFSVILVTITQWRLGMYIRKVGRQSIIIFIFVAVVSCALLMICSSIFIEIRDTPDELFNFNSYCT